MHFYKFFDVNFFLHHKKTTEGKTTYICNKKKLKPQKPDSQSKAYEKDKKITKRL